LLEVAFDWLMEQESKNVLGKHAQLFGTEFPIRFDFLDTWDGGNLSIQCHPSLPYIQEQFGECITQDETYYILDAKEEAKVYLGFQQDIEPVEFKKTLEHSFENNVPVDIEKFVQCHPAQKHDLFLIPNGTVHSAGAGNLVLEISATPYIFTFKMYDWIRPDLDGKPRPINIDHAFHNLNFDRKGDRVQKELISKPCIIHDEPDGQIIHLPTHAQHFYDVHRLEFERKMEVHTEGQCHVLMLVEGHCIELTTADSTSKQFAYAETIVIPAAAQSYQLTNKGAGKVKVIKAFLK
jgi:mannose-6-phosphate isomerase class I